MACSLAWPSAWTHAHTHNNTYLVHAYAVDGRKFDDPRSFSNTLPFLSPALNISANTFRTATGAIAGPLTLRVIESGPLGSARCTLPEPYTTERRPYRLLCLVPKWVQYKYREFFGAKL